MTVSRDLSVPQEGQQVLLFCLLGGDQTAVIARRHWFVEQDSDGSTKRLGWQITWDGSEVPKEWTPYAWMAIECPDPGGDDSPSGA